MVYTVPMPQKGSLIKIEINLWYKGTMSWVDQYLS